MSVCFSYVMGVKNGGMDDTLINAMSLFVISNLCMVGHFCKGFIFLFFSASRGPFVSS